MSRAGGDRSVIQITRPGTSGISNALWPRCVRRSVATDRIAQQRRLLALTRICWATRRQRVRAQLRLFSRLLPYILLVSGIMLGVFVLQYWMILLLLALAWSVIIMLMTRLLCDKIYDMLVLRQGQKQFSAPQKRRTAAAHFPETPMPPTPLIRVLETIDLSRVDVESLMAEIDEATKFKQEEATETGTVEVEQEGPVEAWQSETSQKEPVEEKT